MPDAGTWTTALSIAGSVLAAGTTAAFSYWFTRKQQLAAQWRESNDTADQEANRRFALAANTIALVAPQRVVEAMQSFQAHIRASNPDRSQEAHDRLLGQLVLAIRADLGMKPEDNPATFKYELVRTL
jgi:hypothetical protein